MDECVVLGSISTADGSALVKIGNTTVICGIKAVRIIFIFPKNDMIVDYEVTAFFYLQELTMPPSDAPNKGYIGKCKL